MSAIPILLTLLASGAAPPAEAPVLRVLDASRAGTPLLRDGGFEGAASSRRWRPWREGFRVDASGGRGGGAAAVCERRDGDGETGASQSIALDRTEPFPLVVRGWSRAEGVTGVADRGYSLYVDIVYRDGSPLWGSVASFRCGTHDWQRRELVILPEKPVRTVALHCLFRGHSGRVWFDDVSLEEIRPEGGAVLFQGLPVEVAAPAAARRGTPARGGRRRLRADELELTLDRMARPVGSRIRERELLGRGPGGFLARDVAAGSGFHSFVRGDCAPLGLALESLSVRVERGAVALGGELAVVLLEPME